MTEWLVVGAYATVLGVTVVGLPSMAAALLAVLLLWTGPLAPALAGLAVWFTLATLWDWVVGQPMPVVLFVAAFAWAGWSTRDPFLTDGGRHMAGGEQWGILLAGIAAWASADGGMPWY